MKGRKWLVWLLALVLQGGLLGVALMIGIMEPAKRPEPVLRSFGESPVRERQQQRQAQQQLAQVQRATEALSRQLAQPFLDNAHALPTVERPSVRNAVAAMGAMLPEAGSFGGLDSLLGGDGQDSMPAGMESVSFMGETLNATRIVLALDVSASLKSKLEQAGWSLEAVRDEVLRFLDQLGPNHLFGLIQFTRNWSAFREELVPATEAMRAEARGWIRDHFRTTGTSGRNWRSGNPNGIQAVLGEAFGMDPQLNEIFLLSDGDFYRTPPGGGSQPVPLATLRADTRRLQEQQIGTVRLRVLAFFPPADNLIQLQEWVRENGNGTLRVVSSKD